jgi:hypothetical protein
VAKIVDHPGAKSLGFHYSWIAAKETNRPMTIPLRPLIIATCAVLLMLHPSLPSRAEYQVAHRGINLFDGTWSVVIQTTQGNCPAAIRAGLRILGGRVLSTDEGYSVDGQVAPTGAVRVNISSAGQGADGFGHLSRNTGQGFWRATSGECSGQWTAERREVPEGSTDQFPLAKSVRTHRGYSRDVDW